MALPRLASAFLRTASSAPIYEGAWVQTLADVPGHQHLLLHRSLRDYEDNAVKSSLESYLLPERKDQAGSGCAVFLNTHVLHPRPALVDVSPSGRSRVIAHNQAMLSSSPSPSGSFLEVATSSELFRLDTSALHGKILPLGGAFGGAAWHSSEDFFVYPAAALPLPGETALESLAPPLRRLQEEQDLPSAGGGRRSKYDFQQDWGEKSAGQDGSVLALLTLSKRQVSVLPLGEAFYSEWAVGQPVFANDRLLVFVAWPREARRLGILYCGQRPCQLFAVDILAALAGESVSARALTPSLAIARSPRPSPCGRYLLFLGHAEGFTTHQGPLALYLHDLERDATTCLLEAPFSSSRPAFESSGRLSVSALFLDSLPRSVPVSVHFQLFIASSPPEYSQTSLSR